LVTGTPVNGVYKLVEIDDIPVMKQSSGKVTFPGRKQIFRTVVNGKVTADRLGLMDEKKENGQPLLDIFMKEGKRLKPQENIGEIRQRTSATVASLSEEVRRIEKPIPLHVEISNPLEELTWRTKNRELVSS
jgi:nicotinate phosphoribosyltransferase